MAVNSLMTDGANDNLHTMVNILCNVHRGFKVIHFNARSLNGANLDTVRHIFVKDLVDVLCVSETWFDNDIPDCLLGIDGYDLFRNDRVGRRGGGVAIYCKSSLKARVVYFSSGSDVEYLSIVIPCNCKVLISCVYNPHRNFCLSPFFDVIAGLIVDYDYHVICGNFNVNLLSVDSVSNDFHDLISAVGLDCIHNDLPTRFGHNVLPSLLDLFLVSDRKYVVKFDQIAFISDHDLIFCCLDLPISASTERVQYWLRDFNNIKLESLSVDLSGVDWTYCWSLDSVNDKLEWFICVLSNLYDKFVPLRRVRPRNESVPWFTQSVLNELRARNICRSKWKRNPCSENWNEFVKMRKRAKVVINQAKYNYFSSKLNSSNSTKQLWKNIRKLRVFGNENRVCNLRPDVLNDYFAEVHQSHIKPYDFVSCSLEHPFEFRAVAEDDVLMHLKGITSQAVGSDGLSLRFVKLTLPFTLPMLTHIINHCFTTSIFPNSWKTAIITPIAKKANATCVSDYRPISILPSLAKLLEKLMADQMNKYVISSSLLSPLQSGFRAGVSCETDMLKILDGIRIPFDRNWLTYLCLLDFSKAFDSVDHTLLCAKLEYWFHFSKTAVRFIASFLSNRKQKVCVGNCYSDTVDVGVGVPQGSILGPLLFVMFINDLFYQDLTSAIHAYADDVQLYHSTELCSSADLANSLNADLMIISAWASDNGLKLNANKCCILPICYKRVDFCTLPAIFLENVTLQTVSKVKNLGFIINSKLSCVDHVNMVLSKVYLVLRCLRVTGSFIPLNIKRNLILQLVLPHFNYFCNVYSSLDSVSSKKICVAFNNAIRFVYSLRRSDHVSMFDKSILGVGILDYIEIRNIIFLRNLIYNGVPLYLYNKLSFSRSLRTMNLNVPIFHHLNSSRLFFVNAIRLWNSLPTSLKLVTSKALFRKLIFEFYSGSRS